MSKPKPNLLDRLKEQQDRMNEYKELPSHIVFVETKLDLYLHDAISFSQYIYNKKILITFIGELHKEKFKCDEPCSLSIANYCTNAVKRNNKCKVFLEFNKNENINELNLEGSTLKETFDSLHHLSGFSHIIPFDERPTLITREKQNHLYWLDWSSCSFNQGDVYEYILYYYIEPFKTKDKIFLYESSEFIKGSYNQLQNYYQLFLQKQLFAIEKFIKDEQSKFVQKKSEVEEEVQPKKELALPPMQQQLSESPLKIIQENLRIFWAKVSDFYLLQELFKNNHCNEYIVLLGEAHKRNVCYLFDTFNKNNTIYKKLIDYNNDGNGIGDYSKKCINIFETVMVGSITP